MTLDELKKLNHKLDEMPNSIDLMDIVLWLDRNGYEIKRKRAKK